MIALLDNAGDDKQALLQYKKLVRFSPGEPRFQIELAKRYKRMGQDQRAIDLLRATSSRFPRDESVHHAAADLYTRWGKHQLALKAYIRLTKIEPNESLHWIHLGEHYYIHNQKNKAIATWKRILRKKTADNYGKLGHVYAEHDLLSEAQAMYSKAIEIAPKKTDWWIGRARTFARQQQWKSAIADWQRVFALTKSSKAARGIHLESQRRIVGLLMRTGSGHLRTTMQSWSKAFSQNPPDMEAGLLLVEAYLRLRRYGDAEKVLKRTLKIRPHDTNSMKQLVQVYRNQYEYQKAVVVLEKLAKLEPNLQRHYYTQIAEIKTQSNQHDEALEYAHKALQKGPQNADAYQKLGERYEAMQKRNEALSAYEKAIALNPRSFAVYFTLARLYKSDQANKAAQLYRQVLRLSRDDDTLHRAGTEAINLEEISQTLGQLERTISPLAFRFPHKSVYRRILVELYDRYVPRLVTLSTSADPTKRNHASHELQRLSKHALKPLLEALNDHKDPAQQRIAVAVLGHLHHQGAAAPLIRFGVSKQLGPSLDRDIRVDAIIAAGRLGDPHVIPALLRLGVHRSVAMRQASVFALGLTKSPKAISPLLQHLTDPDQSVQTLACLGLAQHKDLRSVDAMIGVATDSRRHRNARSACTFGLGLTKSVNALPAMITILEHNNDNLQRLAAWSLGNLGDPRAIPPLLRGLFVTKGEIQATIQWSLTQLSSDKSPSISSVQLSQNLQNYPKQHGTFHALAAIRNLPGKLTSPSLSFPPLLAYENVIIAAILDGLGRHRDAVHDTLEDLSRNPYGLSLGSIATEENPTPQEKAALDRVGKAILSQVIELTKHGDHRIRASAVAVAARIGSQEITSVLARALRDSTLPVRVAAMKASTLHTVPSVTKNELHPQMEAALLAKDWRERRAAAKTLGKLNLTMTDQALVAALQDPIGWVREQAAQSLGKLGRTSSVPGLLQATFDPSIAVQLAAVRSLVVIGDPKATQRMHVLSRTHASAQVREAASRFIPTE